MSALLQPSWWMTNCLMAARVASSDGCMPPENLLERRAGRVE